jgi:hypothetical protein
VDVAIGLNDLGVARHQHPHEVLGFAIALLAGNDDFADVAVVEIADRALDQRAFLIDEAGRRRGERQVADILPKPHQIFEVALHFRLGAVGTGRAQDDAHALRNVEIARHFLQALAVGDIGDLAGNAAAARRVRHQDGVAAGERQIGRQRCALVAALFLDDLHQHDLAALDHFLDAVLLARLSRGRAIGKLFEGVLRADGIHLGDRFVRIVASAMPGLGGTVVVELRVMLRIAAVSRFACLLGLQFGGGIALQDQLFGLLGPHFGRRQGLRRKRVALALDMEGGIVVDLAGIALLVMVVATVDRLRDLVGIHDGSDLIDAAIPVVVTLAAAAFRFASAAGSAAALGPLRLRVAVVVLVDDLGDAAFVRFGGAALVRPVGGLVFLVFGTRPFGFGLGLGRKQRLSVGERDLVIIGMNFGEGEEAVAVAAVIHESGLQRGFDPRDLGEIDVSAQLLLVLRLEIEFLYPVATDDNDARLFCMRGVDKHFVRH